MGGVKTLYPHQSEALNLLRHSLSTGHKRPVLMAPTGFGKTVLASAIVQGAMAKGNKVIFCVPRISLIDQTVESFVDDGITDIGVIQANHPLTDPRAPVQVASTQSLARRKIPHADLVVIDECHQFFTFHAKWLERWDNIPFIGLSATPWTKGLGRHYDDLLVAATTKDLIDTGYLSDFTAYAPSSPDLSGIKIVAGDYHEGMLADRMDKDPLVADIVDTWRKRGEDRPTLVFAVNRAHAKHIQAKFLEAAIPAEYVDCFTDLPEREAISRRFHDGTTKIVCNVGVLTTGVDWDVRCIVLARPTRSRMLFVQMIGRGLRTAPGKTDLLILDHSDTHSRLGFVTDIHQTHLDTGGRPERTQEQRERLPKPCPSCAFMKPPGTHQCPSCGFKPVAVPSVDHIDGELRLITRKPSPDDKQQTYSQLAYIAVERGYSEGWIAHTYREMYGIWPRKVNRLQYLKPSEEVLAFVQQKMKAYRRQA